jgi:hypothetical protein
MDAVQPRRLVWRASAGALARPGDRLEALVLVVILAAGLVVIGLGVRLGEAMASGLADSERNLRAGQYSSLATVAPGAWPMIGSPAEGAAPRWIVPVTWESPGGPRSGRVTLDHGPAAGEVVPIVGDPDGGAVPARALGDPVVNAYVVGVVAVLAGWVFLALLWLVIEMAYMRHHYARWAAEWERVEPLWSGRPR